MPVKVEAQGRKKAGLDISADIDLLVKEVQETLCLKQREKLHAYRTGPYSPKGPPRGHRTNSRPHEFCRNTSPTHSGNYYKMKSSCLSSAMLQTGSESPQILLQELLNEQKLIQEAVKRLQAMREKESTSQAFSSGSWNEVNSWSEGSTSNPFH